MIPDSYWVIETTNTSTIVDEFTMGLAAEAVTERKTILNYTDAFGSPGWLVVKHIVDVYYSTPETRAAKHRHQFEWEQERKKLRIEWFHERGLLYEEED